MPFQKGNKLGGRRRESKWIRKLAADQTEAAVYALTQALKAKTVVVVGTGGNAHTEEIPDHRVRVMAANALLDRAYGKPAQEVNLNVEPDQLHERLLAIAGAGSSETDTAPTGEPH